MKAWYICIVWNVLESRKSEQSRWFCQQFIRIFGW